MVSARNRDGRFAKAVPDHAPNLARAAALSGVPGAVGVRPSRREPFQVLGITWRPEDSHQMASPIGFALAMEWAAARKASETEAAQEPA